MAARFGVQAGIQGSGSGYWRGFPPQAGGTGSMAGPSGAGAPTMTSKGSKDWHPTVASLLGLVVLEVVAYSALRYFFRNAHGG